MDLFITVATLLAAIYAVIPRDRQLDLRLRLSVLDWLFVLVAFLAVAYLQFYAFFNLHDWGLRSLKWFPRSVLDGLHPKDATYIVIILLTAWLIVRLRFARVSVRKIRQFRDLAEELFWSESFGDLFALLDEHLRVVFRICRCDFVRARLHRFVYPDPVWSGHGLLKGDSEKPDPVEAFRSLGRWLIWPIAGLLGSGEREQAVAQELLRGILLSERVVRALVRTRPYLGLRVIRAWPDHGRFEFLDLYLKELLNDSTSVLFHEIRSNQNVGGLGNRYVIPSNNRILTYFLADASVAYDTEVYRPVGDHVIAYLDRLARDRASDPYSWAMDSDFREHGAWRSSLFVAIRFFDIMVKEALYQGIEWHMWLYYFPEFVERLVRNCNFDDPLIDPVAEWPNRYCFLLYNAIDAMCDWIEAAEEIDPTQKNVVLASVKNDHENGNIPKSAILALALCVREIVVSENIPDSFKSYIADIVCRLYFKLRGSGKLVGYAQVLSAALVDGGFYRRAKDEDYRSRLLSIFGAQLSEYEIKYPQGHAAELLAALSQNGK